MTEPWNPDTYGETDAMSKSPEAPPKRIWLKAYNGSFTHPSTTWAETSCGPDCNDDVEYVRADATADSGEVAARAAALEEAAKIAYNYGDRRWGGYGIKASLDIAAAIRARAAELSTLGTPDKERTK